MDAAAPALAQQPVRPAAARTTRHAAAIVRTARRRSWGALVPSMILALAASQHPMLSWPAAWRSPGAASGEVLERGPGMGPGGLQPGHQIDGGPLRSGRSGQGELPVLPDQVVTAAVALLRPGELEAGPLIDPARRVEHVVGPQHDLGVAGPAGECHALRDEGPPPGPAPGPATRR